MKKVPKAKCHKCIHCEKINSYTTGNEVKCDKYCGGLGLAIRIPLYCRYFTKLKKGGEG